MVLQVAGNLAITQAVVTLLREHENSTTRPEPGPAVLHQYVRSGPLRR